MLPVEPVPNVSNQRVDLEAVVATPELSRRAARPPDYARENAALVKLATAMAQSPKDILQRLVEAALELCGAGSAGISLLEEEGGQKIFRWHALTGALASHLWGTTPRDFSPCGTVVDRNATQLFRGLDRHFTYFAEVKPRIVEALLIPFGVGGKTVGTLWVVTHDDRRHFDAEDSRLIGNLANFAGAAYQVRSALEASLEADRRKDEFLITLAHELRNPLAPIQQAVQSLGQEGLARSDLELAREILRRQVRHLTRLIDDLLDMSRVRLGKIELRKERFELATVVQGALETSRPLLDACRHAFALTLPAEPVWVEADAARLAQIVTNLVNNAAKYTNECGHVSLTAEREGPEVVLRVQDDGIGISLDMLPKIFDLFTQVDTSRVRSRGGLGVGLALVKNLVQLHGGTVAVRSAGKDRGSEFIVRLPIAVEGPRVLRAKPPEPLGLPAPRCLRLLVVDDNVDSAESFAILLRFSGHEVRTAYDGPSALGMVADYAPRVVLLDIGLPGMDGYEVARRLRQHPATAGALLIAVSGYGQAEDRNCSREAGFDHHLVKPVDFEELGSLLAAARGVVV